MPHSTAFQEGLATIEMEIKYISSTAYVVSGVHLRNLNLRRYCVFDLEATGPDPDHDFITQIGAVIIENGAIQEHQTFETLVKPPKPIPEKIERLTGISNHDLETARSFAEVFEEFREFCKGSVLVTQAGYEFDHPLLQNECIRNGRPIIKEPVIDTKALYTYLYPDVSEIVSTNYLIRQLGIYDQDIRRHRALGDSILIARIFLKLLEECNARGLQSISFDDLQVKRVKLDPLL